jgi:mannosyltransferase OCH1-like enzyme
MNPNYAVKIWREHDMETLVRDHYPWFWKTFASFDRNIKRLDTLRYAIMHHEGGVFSDMDINASTPMDSLLADVDILMVQGNIGFMASIPGHKLWETYLRAAVNVHALPPIADLMNGVICAGGMYVVDMVWRQSFRCLPQGEGQIMGANYKFAASSAELGLNHTLTASWTKVKAEGPVALLKLAAGDEGQAAWSEECEEVQQGFNHACKIPGIDPSMVICKFQGIQLPPLQN